MGDPFHQHMTQRVYSDPNWRVNCSAYVTAMLLNDASLGAIKITGRIVRAESSEPNPSPSSPGLNLTQCVNVARKYRVELTDHQGQSWSQVMAAVRQGRRVFAQLDYATLGKHRCQAGGDFGHAFLLIRDAPGGLVRGSDPLCSESKAYPEAVIQEAMRVFARATGVSTGLRWGASRIVPETARSID